MQNRSFINLYRYQLEPSDWHLVTFFMTYILYDIYFFTLIFCKFENGPHPVMAHLNYDVWFHITSYYICVNWLLIHNTVITSDFMVCAIFFFSFRCLFHHTAYLRKSTDNKTIRCLLVFICCCWFICSKIRMCFLWRNRI